MPGRNERLRPPNIVLAVLDQSGRANPAQAPWACSSQLKTPPSLWMPSSSGKPRWPAPIGEPATSHHPGLTRKWTLNMAQTGHSRSKALFNSASRTKQ